MSGREGRSEGFAEAARKGETSGGRRRRKEGQEREGRIAADCVFHLGDVTVRRSWISEEFLQANFLLQLLIYPILWSFDN